MIFFKNKKIVWTLYEDMYAFL